MDDVVDFFKGLFQTDRWPPRWKCGYWSDFHGWLYIVSDLMIWTAYFLIPLFILNYVSKRKERLKFPKVYFLFAAFILLCGSTHFLDALMFWIPMYRLNALVRFATGIVSLLTVYHLVRILPEAFKQKTSLELEREIARRKDAERKLAEANNGLQAFAYIASHDLQEPLRKIRTFSSLLYDANKETFDARSKGLATKIMSASERMQLLVQDVLNLSLISGEVELTATNPVTAVDNARENLEIKIGEKSALIQVGNLPLVIGNEGYLTQLFTNLISNAIKFSVEQPVITIRGEQIGRRVIITVSDNGIGMSDDDTKKIFHAFHRLHSRSAYEGSGIGLAICKKIVEVHRGNIEVKSKKDEGTMFTIELEAV